MRSNNNINIIKDFYAQLARVDELDVFPIINAISSNFESVDTLIHNSIKIEPWMLRIGLEDIRNIIIFVLWRDFKKICSLEEAYIPEEEAVRCLKKPCNGYTDNLIKLLETCFYVKQIYYVKKHIIPQEWDRFLPFINSYYTKHGLKKMVLYLAKLIVPLQQTF